MIERNLIDGEYISIPFYRNELTKLPMKTEQHDFVLMGITKNSFVVKVIKKREK